MPDLTALLKGASSVNARADAVAHLRVDGARFIALLRIDQREHLWRRTRGLGAVTSKRLLHALWNLPLGIAFPTAAFDPVDLATFVEEGQRWVETDGSTIIRRYRPAGLVDCVAAADRVLARAVARVGCQPTTVQRLAIWYTPTGKVTVAGKDALARAHRSGIGVLAIGNWGSDLLLEPAASIVGRPAIFRWWQAEIAYRDWLRRTAPTESAATSE